MPKVFYNKKDIDGDLRTRKSVLKTYSRNFQKIIFDPEIYDFVINFS